MSLLSRLATAIQLTRLTIAFGAVSDIWFVILLAVNLQSAFLTPPFGFALFYMRATVPPEVTMAHIYRGIIPLVMLQVLTLTMCIYWPEIILILPRYFGFLS